ncbi:MAG: hypothetical protein J6Y67_00625 [Lachnospiraceae bacterium]|nr:hypothetical protein [Lachnospiraceae bacterium]
MKEFSTNELFQILCRVRNKDELKAYLENVCKRSHELSLHNYLNTVIHDKGLALRNVVLESGLEQHYAYQIINGNKLNPSRIKVIAMCIACHMTVAEAQHALEISRQGILCPYEVFDAIIIYHLNMKDWSVYSINESLHAEGRPIIE